MNPPYSVHDDPRFCYTILYPSFMKIFKKSSTLVILESSSPIFTLSNTYGRFCQLCFPQLGANIGASRKIFLGNSLTNRTSTNRVFFLRCWKSKNLSTDLVEMVDVQMRITLGCCSQRSWISLKKLAPMDCATKRQSNRKCGYTMCPKRINALARN
ncbi:hypothetical protein CDL12_11303 [Handroanthus impetiginosus]|uniref:Uncharacterized protein n=1 Tax=Handroanthus impetiginosus TaxID=429701 RepID=A0A2G9HET0_9LAMI|nr:hypothetical protein CDL12_11303 [Handroanthus impetiginosus]